MIDPDLQRARDLAQTWCEQHDADLAVIRSRSRRAHITRDRERLALWLHDVGDVSQSTIARMLGRHPSSVCTAIARARDRSTQTDTTPAGMKWCPDCATWKAVDDFHANRSAYDGLSSYCAPCSRARLTADRRRAGMKAVPKGRDTVQQNIKMDRDLSEQLHQAADHLGITMSAVVENLIKPALPKLLEVCRVCRAAKADDGGMCVGCIGRAMQQKRGRWSA